MKQLLTIVFLIFSFTCYSQDTFLFSFNSKQQVLNGDTLNVNVRVEISNTKIKIFRETTNVLQFDVNLKKQGNIFYDIEPELHTVRFDANQKVLYIETSKIIWTIAK